MSSAPVVLSTVKDPTPVWFEQLLLYTTFALDLECGMNSKLTVTMILAAALCAGCSSGLKRAPMVEVAPGVYEGCKPQGQEDFTSLKKAGIKTVLSLETFPWNVRPESRL